jgi:hypothetical protein
MKSTTASLLTLAKCKSRRRFGAPIDRYEQLDAGPRKRLPILESEARVQLKLTSGSDCGEYSAGVIGEIASRIFEDRVTVPPPV